MSSFKALTDQELQGILNDLNNNSLTDERRAWAKDKIGQEIDIEISKTDPGKISNDTQWDLFKSRLAVKNLGTNDKDNIRYLRENNPEKDFRLYKGDILAKDKNAEQWGRLDPEGFDLQDISDLGYEALETGVGLLGRAGGGAVGLAGGAVGGGGIGAVPGAIIGQAAGAGLAAAGSEGIRQALSSAIGLNNRDFSDIAKDVAITGAVGAVLPTALKSVGKVASGALRKVGSVVKKAPKTIYSLPFRKFDFATKQAGKGQTVSDILYDRNVVGGFDQVAETLQKAGKESVEGLGNLAKKADTAGARKIQRENVYKPIIEKMEDIAETNPGAKSVAAASEKLDLQAKIRGQITAKEKAAFGEKLAAKRQKDALEGISTQRALKEKQGISHYAALNENAMTEVQQMSSNLQKKGLKDSIRKNVETLGDDSIKLHDKLNDTYGVIMTIAKELQKEQKGEAAKAFLGAWDKRLAVLAPQSALLKKAFDLSSSTPALTGVGVILKKLGVKSLGELIERLGYPIEKLGNKLTATQLRGLTNAISRAVNKGDIKDE